MFIHPLLPIFSPQSRQNKTNITPDQLPKPFQTMSGTVSVKLSN